MRILLVSHTEEPVSGWGRYTRDLARALREKGHEVTVLSEWLVERGDALCPPEKHLGASFAFFRDRRRIARAIRVLNPDVVHVTVEPYLGAVPLAALAGRKLVLTVHGTFAYYPERMYYPFRLFGAWRYRRALAKVTMVTPVSASTASALTESLARTKVPCPPLTVIHNGVSMADHQGERTTHDGFVVLSVGAVKVRKGILETLQGIVQLKKQFGVHAVYRVIGDVAADDAYAARLLSYARANNAESQLQLMGRQSDDALKAAFLGADVLALLPQQIGTTREGFGLVYLEANAYGVPALGARGTVSEEAIKDGVSGLLADASDPESVARALYAIHSGAITPDGAREWAAAHDWSVVAEEYERVYATT